jgi:hypothetical protein
MWRTLNRLLPETIFPRRFSDAGERRLRLAQARAEETLIDAHVQNALLFVDALADDVPYDRAIDVYIRELAIPEPLASTVATRTLVKLGEAMDPAIAPLAPPPAPVDAPADGPEARAEADEAGAPMLRLEVPRKSSG